jgi:type II secretion system protein G
MRTEENKTVQAMRAGFTLIEILVAVAIIGILGAVAVTNVIASIEKAKQTAAKEAVGVISNAVTQYYLENKKYPGDLQDLIRENGDNEPILDGGEGALEDPWGTMYKLEKKGKRYVVVSAGPDMDWGTDDDIRSDTTKK